jgi:hypothetical protein
LVLMREVSFPRSPRNKKGVKKIRTILIKDIDLIVDLLLNCDGAVERFFPMACENITITCEVAE